LIPVEETAKKWLRDPAFVKAYDALEYEFALASPLVKARRHIGFEPEKTIRPATKKASP
jgi:hypothetical protein